MIDIKSRLMNFHAAGRFPHAIIFHGGSEGNRDAANFTAKHLLCRSDNAPCGECKSCLKIENAVHPDLIFVKEQMPDGKYKIQNLRTVIADANRRPNDGNLKIYIFENADLMSDVCQNALLKLIEEPPEFVKFIFTAENLSRVLETVRSRLVVINTGDEKINSETDELQEVQRKILESIFSCSEYKIMCAFSLLKDREDVRKTLKYLSVNIHERSKKTYDKKLIRVSEFILSCIEKLEFNPNISLALTYYAKNIYEILYVDVIKGRNKVND